MARPITLEAVRSAPKVVLHDHLDGGLRPATIVELADAVGYRGLPSTDLTELAAWFTRGADTRDILQYLATFTHTLAVMQTEEALHRVAKEAALDLATDGVVYAEVRFAPELHQEHGLSLDAIVDAVQQGFRDGEAQANHTIVMRTILCAMRTEARSVEIAELCVRRRRNDDTIVSFDLAGAETGFPPSDHAEAVAIARTGLAHLTIHASEPPGLELIADALACGAERIGHGVRLVEDVTFDGLTFEARVPEGGLVDIDLDRVHLGPLATYVRDRQIPLELAPTCNVQIGAVPTLAHHPVALFHRLGLRASINTDNRLMSGVSVAGEVHAVATVNHFDWLDIEAVQVTGIQSAFCSLDERRRIECDIIRPAYTKLDQE
jgi:adenosine deaminase